MKEYKYNKVTIETTGKILKQFFSYGEIGSCFFIFFHKTDCFFQIAVNKIENEIIDFEFGLPNMNWSKEKWNPFLDYFKENQYKYVIETNSINENSFLRLVFTEDIDMSIKKTLEILVFFITTFELGKSQMNAKIIGDFYGDRYIKTIKEDYEKLDINKLGRIGKIIYQYIFLKK